MALDCIGRGLRDSVPFVFTGSLLKVAEFAILDMDGNTIGRVYEEPLGRLPQAAGQLDSLVDHHLVLVEEAGMPQLTIDRPAYKQKPVVIVRDSSDQEVGRLPSSELEQLPVEAHQSRQRRGGTNGHADS